MAIVGYMGSGKTTLGLLLARSLGCEFVDLDREISRQAGKEIPDIFSESGEEAFRTIEHEALAAALAEAAPCIIACGGGVVVRQENRSLLRDVTTVFLVEDTGVLYTRTRGPGRPLRSASREEFERRYAERLPLYRDVADLEVDADGRPPGLVAEEVLECLSKL